MIDTKEYKSVRRVKLFYEGQNQKNLMCLEYQ